MKIDSNIAIQLNNVTKKFKIFRPRQILVERLLNKKNESFYALKNINLTVKKGDRIGIIGPNGSGKTTLIKVISGITNPTSGTVNRYGKVISVIDIEAGFHPELTGKQNIFLNGFIIGMKKSEINAKLESIVKFADIGNHINLPFYTYSNGMKLRLGLSIALYADPDILILDENIYVGDADFQNKVLAAVRQKQRNKNITTIICSHYNTLIWEYSNIFYKMNQGTIQKASSKEVLSNIYQEYRIWSKSYPTLPKGDKIGMKNHLKVKNQSI